MNRKHGINNNVIFLSMCGQPLVEGEGASFSHHQTKALPKRDNEKLDSPTPLSCFWNIKDLQTTKHTKAAWLYIIVWHMQKWKGKGLSQISHLTLFIAVIALVAPFMPAATEVWACIACSKDEIVRKTTKEKCRKATYTMKFSKDSGLLEYELLCLSSELDYLAG